ncbi:aldo/keto reductase [Rhodobacteraceae bacterium M385]|nr:aldo/keto reductase [Rhodobacteraceae bacterium M385]
MQFGLAYGVANRTGRPDIGRTRDILDLAYTSGLRTLDTAAMYGDSERVLGECGVNQWSIITKAPSLERIDDAEIERSVRTSVHRSLDLLRVDALHAVLAHDSRDMVGDRGRRFRDALAAMRADGLIGRIGVSVYRPEDMAEIEDDRSQIVQAPFNVLDQGFIQSGRADSLRRGGGELHVRSVFLQGLLLMNASDRPARFARWAPTLSRFDERVRDSGLTPAAFCLGFAARQADVTHCVVGVDSAQQLSELVAAFNAGQSADIGASDLGSDELGLIDPRHWKDDA